VQGDVWVVGWVSRQGAGAERTQEKNKLNRGGTIPLSKKKGGGGGRAIWIQEGGEKVQTKKPIKKKQNEGKLPPKPPPTRGGPLRK